MVFVPSTPALLPQYASTVDPVAELRAAVGAAVSWLLEDGDATHVRGSLIGDRIVQHLLGDRRAREIDDRTNRLVVANGSATRTEKAPGHLDERAAGFDAAIGAALRAGDPAGLAAIDVALAAELWAMPDADVLRSVGRSAPQVLDVRVDYDDAPYGVQYWVVRWECAS
ncbi:MAG: hypothetical protein ACJ72D_27205 [Marmoricola sp.]